MPAVRNASGELLLGGCVLAELARDPVCGTPTYVYDLDAMAGEADALARAFERERHLIAYAVKANAAGPVLRVLAASGCGADVVSGGELALALGAHVPPEKIVYSGVAKTNAEIDQALSAGPHGIGALQAESVEELARVRARAEALGRAARVSIRVNPELSMDALATHAHVATGHDSAKFGVARADMARAIELATSTPGLALVGLAVHGGSQLTSVAPYLEAARGLFELAKAALAKGAPLEFVDTGGGFGIDYGDVAVGPRASPAEFVAATRAAKRAAGLDALALHVEPGRALVGPHGVLLARVVQTKTSGAETDRAMRWLMIDAGMNDLVRPALYQARHRIVPLVEASDRGAAIPWRVVGPVCESADDFGTHVLPASPPADVAILDSGAYGYAMASRYNGRALPAEVFLRGGAVLARSERAPPEAWVEERLAIGGDAHFRPSSRPI